MKRGGDKRARVGVGDQRDVSVTWSGEHSVFSCHALALMHTDKHHARTHARTVVCRAAASAAEKNLMQRVDDSRDGSPSNGSPSNHLNNAANKDSNKAAHSHSHSASAMRAGLSLRIPETDGNGRKRSKRSAGDQDRSSDYNRPPGR
jgi:hypothetical protein